MEQVVILRETGLAAHAQGVNERLPVHESLNVRKAVQPAFQKMTPDDNVAAYLELVTE